ncbi:MAG TPA: allophanate hydrolase [Pseudonocardiaceae bacterium]|nr:allophanate hydrolase [Pseudonocardiaceae bacterium]
MGSPIHTIGVGELQVAYATEQLSPQQVLDLVLERIAARGQDSVWISRRPDHELYQRAADLDRIRHEHGTTGLPLFGVPCAVKDNIDVAGLATTAACPAFSYQPARDAGCVARLIDAGAIVIGKTNMDQFATGLTGTRSPYGTCVSVFGGGLIAGGSSSGSAVAVAAGLVSFALGTDTAGSGRVPAAMNGIIGCKPTRGLVSAAGVVPACRSLDCVSIFTADTADATTVLAVTRGPDPADPWSRPVSGNASHSADYHSRVAVPVAAELDFEGDDAMRDAFDVAVARAGEITPTTIAPLLEAGELLYHGPWVAERLAELEEFFAEHPEDVLPITRQVIEGGRRFDAVATFRAWHRLKELQRWTEQLWQRADLLIMPTVPTTFTVDEIAEEPVRRNTVLARFTQFVNLLDLAAVTVPAGRTADGRPASITVIGPAFSEPLLLSVATRLAEP